MFRFLNYVGNFTNFINTYNFIKINYGIINKIKTEIHTTNLNKINYGQ